MLMSVQHALVNIFAYNAIRDNALVVYGKIWNEPVVAFWSVKCSDEKSDVHCTIRKQESGRRVKPKLTFALQF